MAERWNVSRSTIYRYLSKMEKQALISFLVTFVI
ncbi:helix-turn-helix domain-containing protein [Enterococcus ratti]